MNIDINECALCNGGCQHTCINTEGNYSCSCDSGYVIKENGFSCEGMSVAGIVNPIITSNKNFILKYFRCRETRDGKRTETRIGMEARVSVLPIPAFHCTLTVYMQHIMAHSGGMQEWVIQIPSIPILVSVLFPSLHLKYFRIKFLLLVCIVFMHMRTKPHPHPVIS